VLDPGLQPANPLDIWGTGRDTERQFAESLTVMSADPAVAAVALAVDLVPEFDGDQSYPRALLAAAARTSKPLAVLAGVPASIDPVVAARMRQAGVPVLEGARTGLLALRHLLDHQDRVRARAAGGGQPERGSAARPGQPEPGSADRGGRSAPGPAAAAGAGGARRPAHNVGRRSRWANALANRGLSGAGLPALLRDYGIPAVRVRAAASSKGVLAAARHLGYPVVLKTHEPGVAHKSDVGGVLLGLDGPDALAAAYRDLSVRLGPRVLVCETAAPGIEMLLGIVRDPALGPLIVVGAGGVLTELLADRVVALPPVDHCGALRMLRRLRVSALLDGARGQPPADLAGIAAAITGLSALACDLGDTLDALDINPLICGPAGSVAVDALIVPRPDPTA